MTYKVDLPLSVMASGKKKFLINLNAYRNAHYFTLNGAKISFKEEIYSQLMNLPSFGKVRLIYHLYPGSNRDLDVSNLCSIADKFFSDALVEAGKIEDDNYNFIPEISFKFIAVDKTNPRIEVLIEELEPMQIILGEDEINAAVEQYVRNQINIIEGQELSFDFKAARGDHGMTATVSIGAMKPANPTPAPTAPTKLQEPTSPTVPVTGTAPTQAAPASMTNGPTGNPSEPVKPPVTMNGPADTAEAKPVEETGTPGSIFNLKS